MEGVTLRQKTSSASSQKDKSTKRKSNLNRALNEEQVISAIAESPGEMAPPSPASLPPGDSWDSARIFGMLEIQLEKFMSGMYFLGGVTGSARKKGAKPDKISNLDEIVHNSKTAPQDPYPFLVKKRGIIIP